MLLLPTCDLNLFKPTGLNNQLKKSEKGVESGPTRIDSDPVSLSLSMAIKSPVCLEPDRYYGALTASLLSVSGASTFLAKWEVRLGFKP